MQNIKINKDRLLQQRLNSLSVDNDEYWSFKGDSNREYCHGIFQYPAMMVPKLVRVLLKEICTVEPRLTTVGDPFVGSGTVLTESLLQGKNFWGVDINPLAALLCKVKQGPFFITELRGKIERLRGRLAYKRNNIDAAFFPNVDKWFRDDVKVSLTKVRDCIRTESEKWARRFFWVAMAETVRLTSNSRTSTFKLHIRTPEDIYLRENDVEAIFIQTVERNFILYREQSKKLNKLGLLNGGKYSRKVEVTLDDVRQITPKNKCDLIITSPPYGDNSTTVPYGQYSYLPLQWIDLADISEDLAFNPLASTYAIDSASLGGCRKITNDDINRICNLSESFLGYTESIASEPRDRLTRVAAFIKDLNCGLPRILDSLSPGGIMVWVLGNRTVGGQEVPFDQILIELFQAHCVNHICTINRSIPTKRMATKNNMSKTMSRERIVVTRKN